MDSYQTIEPTTSVEARSSSSSRKVAGVMIAAGVVCLVGLSSIESNQSVVPQYESTTILSGPNLGGEDAGAGEGVYEAFKENMKNKKTKKPSAFAHNGPVVDGVGAKLSGTYNAYKQLESASTIEAMHVSSQNHVHLGGEDGAAGEAVYLRFKDRTENKHVQQQSVSPQNRVHLGGEDEAVGEAMYLTYMDRAQNKNVQPSVRPQNGARLGGEDSAAGEAMYLNLKGRNERTKNVQPVSALFGYPSPIFGGEDAAAGEAMYERFMEDFERKNQNGNGQPSPKYNAALGAEDAAAGEALYTHFMNTHNNGKHPQPQPYHNAYPHSTSDLKDMGLPNAALGAGDAAAGEALYTHFMNTHNNGEHPQPQPYHNAYPHSTSDLKDMGLPVPPEVSSEHDGIATGVYGVFKDTFRVFKPNQEHNGGIQQMVSHQPKLGGEDAAAGENMYNIYKERHDNKVLMTDGKQYDVPKITVGAEDQAFGEAAYTAYQQKQEKNLKLKLAVKPLAGGFTDKKPADNTSNALVQMFDADIRAAVDVAQKYDMKVVEYSTQVVNGVNYSLVVAFGNKGRPAKGYLHVKIYEPLPHANALPLLSSVEPLPMDYYDMF